MKHVAKLTASPPGLATYRATNRIPLRADGAKIWAKFRKKKTAYKELKEALIKKQQGLCAYCELSLVDAQGLSIIDHQQIEHIRPKSLFPNETLDWENLIVCCLGGTNPQAGTILGASYYTPLPQRQNETCGQRKENLLIPQGCDPRTFTLNASPVCIVTSDGRLEVDDAACQAQGINEQDLEELINNTLNLNCTRLVLARHKHYGDMTAIWELDNELVQYTRLTPAQRTQRALLMVAGLLQPDAHGNLMRFWSTTRSVLEPLATQWLQQHTEPDGTIIL